MRKRFETVTETEIEKLYERNKWKEQEGFPSLGRDSSGRLG